MRRRRWTILAKLRYLRAVEACPGARDWALALLPLYAGTRIAEIRALDVADVRLSAHKGEKSRTVVFGAGVRAIPFTDTGRGSRLTEPGRCQSRSSHPHGPAGLPSASRPNRNRFRRSSCWRKSSNIPAPGSRSASAAACSIATERSVAPQGP